MNKFVAIVGMCGAGKSVVADEFVNKGFHFFRFGQITLDIIKDRGLEPNEETQKKVREAIREKYGMGGFATLNLPKIEELLQKGNVIGDGLYSWEEYKILKEKFPNMIILGIHAPPELRYERLSQRQPDENDTNLRNHHFTKEEAKSRDISEIEKCDKGGPIAMADIILNNTSTIEDIKNTTNQIIDKIEGKQPEENIEAPQQELVEEPKEEHVRPTWDEYFMSIMKEVAKRGTCDRGRTGCVIVRDKRILATGYVGSPRGLPHCDEVGHQIKKTVHENGEESQHCVRTAHAEMNAICNAARHGIPVEGSTIYTKFEPCGVCAKAIINSGVKRVVCEKMYHAAKDTREMFIQAGVELEVLNKELESYKDQ
jgi:dCMP deaminase